MSALLSEVVRQAADTAHLVFGIDGSPTPGAALVEAGSRSFTADADADAVGVVMTNDQPTVEVLFGAIATGATLVSLPVPSRGADIAAYAAFLRAVCDRQGLREVVATDDVAALLDGVGVTARRHSDLGRAPLATPDGSGFRLVQFSSGSTDQPKPVLLDDVALGANVDAIVEVLAVRIGDGSAVSWLPLSHDMGLVGMLLAGLAAVGDAGTGRGHVVLLDPSHFLRRPALWMEAVSRWQGTFTAAPDFGYRMAALRTPASSALDLESLRVAIVGGEIVRAETLSAFTEAFTARGLPSSALCPAYGLAEAALAVTFTPPDEPWRHRTVSTEALAGERLDQPTAGEAATALVASGPPLPSFVVRCDAGPDNTGPIAVRGPSIGADGATGAPLADADGWYQTGDAGFLDDGWLYVCGRVDDYLVAHGRNIYAPAVEAAVGAVDGVRSGRVTAVGLPTGDWCIVAEPATQQPPTPADVDRLRNDIRRAVVRITAAQPDGILVVDRGALPLTSSGKLQRHEVRAQILRGELMP